MGEQIERDKRAIWGGFCSPIVTYFALNWHSGFAIPMPIGTIGGLISLLLA
jgi:SHS family lactate transporter-like MFS transporter